MLTVESKMRILENFHAIDYTLFGKPVTKIETCCPATIQEYLTVKGALLSVMIEMNKLVTHVPDKVDTHLTSSDLKYMARESASIARENAKILVSSEQGRLDIKNELKKSINENEHSGSVEEFVQEKIREKSFSLALDNLLIARTVNESLTYENLNEVEGTILEDAYKVLRDSLVEIAIFIDEYASITN